MELRLYPIKPLDIKKSYVTIIKYMTYHKSNDRVSSELFSDREGESPAVSSPRFRQETNFPRELRF